MEDNALLCYSLSTIDNMHPKLPYSLHLLALKFHMCQQSFISMGVHFTARAVLHGKHKCLTGVCACVLSHVRICDPMDCSPPGSSVHVILQARILEWVAIPCLRESSPPRDQTQVSCIAGRFYTVWATREDLDVGNQQPKIWGRGAQQPSIHSSGVIIITWHHFYPFLFCTWYPVIALTLNVFF